MTFADADAPSGGALRLVVTAERLFAVHGIDGVSLRQIAAEASFANNSAVHYHFGSKDGLIEAIFRHRLPQLISERRLLASQCDLTDVRSRFSAHYLPLLHMAEATDNHYVTFIEQLQRRGLAAGRGSFALPDEGARSDEEFRRDLDGLLTHIGPPVRAMRIVDAQLLCLHAAADREHAVLSAAEVAPFELYASALFDGITGFLTAPMSDATSARVDRVTTTQETNP